MGTMIYDRLRASDKRLYDELKRGLLTYAPSLSTGGSAAGEKLQQILYMVLADNPSIVYFDKTELTMVQGFFGGNSLKLSGCKSPSEARRQEVRLMERVKTIAEEIEQMLPDGDYERAMFAYSYLQSHFVYDDEEFAYNCRTGNCKRPDSHNAYGVLVNGKGVCDGFSGAFCMLMQYWQIPCCSISGKAAFHTTVPSGHQWNMVTINRQNVHCDVTWDLDDYQSYHRDSMKYFCVSDNYICKNHQWDRQLYPASESQNLSYFVRKGFCAHTWEQFDRIVDITAKSREPYCQILFGDTIVLPSSANTSQTIAQRVQNVIAKRKDSFCLSYKWDDTIRCFTFQCRSAE